MSTPRLSYILATDRLETVRGVIEALARQTRADLIELVLVSPAPLEREAERIPHGFRAVRAVRCPAPLRLPDARARGIRAAQAPAVFVGETHSFPEPEMVERLLAALDGGWSAAVPALVNGNPSSATSWAGFLLDYGTWHAARAGGEVDEPLVYNAAFRRQALLDLGDRLATGLSAVDHDLWNELAAHGHRAGFVPEARIRHLNVARSDAFLRERFFCGIRLGGHRARRWSRLRCLAYSLASPLAALRLALRSLPALRHYAASGTIPRATWGWILLALSTRVTGEAAGYLGLGIEPAESVTTDIEVHKLRYAREAG